MRRPSRLGGRRWGNCESETLLLSLGKELMAACGGSDVFLVPVYGLD